VGCGACGGILAKRQRKFCSRACTGKSVGTASRPAWNRGLPHKEETKAKIRSSLKGRKMPYVAQANKARVYLGFRKSSSENLKSLWADPKFRISAKQRMSGDKSPVWVADRSSLVHRNYSPELYRWRISVKKRDGYKCRISNKDCKGNLEVHHILPWRNYPELRFEENNGITLCHAHHPRAHAEEKRLAPLFQELITN
jgi:hypothetical protein